MPIDVGQAAVELDLQLVLRILLRQRDVDRARHLAQLVHVGIGQFHQLARIRPVNSICTGLPPPFRSSSTTYSAPTRRAILVAQVGGDFGGAALALGCACRCRHRCGRRWR
jgi:hypothetical protein